jgi:hypothetical protein
MTHRTVPARLTRSTDGGVDVVHKLALAVDDSRLQARTSVADC